jgi:hypothetical protein
MGYNRIVGVGGGDLIIPLSDYLTDSVHWKSGHGNVIDMCFIS